jgi:hypothetical protein
MEQEVVKLLNVLRRVARAARYAEWTRSSPDATQFCVAQYNRILARLGELEPAMKPLFAPLSDNASPEVIRMAARELHAYFEVDDARFAEIPPIPPVPPVFHFRCGPRRKRRVRWVPFAVKCD